MNSRGQGISVNVIIIAAIALVVMVILIALVLNTGGGLNQGVFACESLGTANADYQCADEFTGCQDGWVRANMRSCQQEGTVCCIPLG